MDPIILAYVTAWLLMRGYEALKAEWKHTRDGYARTLGKDHPDWSPARIRRNARHAARSWWWTEVSDGLPTFRTSWEKNKLLARTQREEMLAAGEHGLRALRDRLEAAVKARQDATAARKAAAAPEPPPQDAPGKPALKGIDGGKAPRRPGTPAPGTQAEPPVPPAPEPQSPEPPGTGSTPEPPQGAPAPEPPGAEPPGPEPVLVRDLREAGRCTTPTGVDADGPAYCGQPNEPGGDTCGWHVPPPGDTHQMPAGGEQANASMGDDALAIASTAAAQVEQVANGGSVTTAADLETGDSKYDAMLGFLNKQEKQAALAGSANCDALDAAGSATGLNRPPAVAAALAAIKDAEQAREAAYASAARVLTAHHEQGKEYHGDGQGANREAFTGS